MNLYFLNAKKEEKLIAKNVKEEAAPSLIRKDAAARSNGKFKIYYIRIWKETEKIWYDVGSHSEFYLLY